MGKEPPQGDGPEGPSDSVQVASYTAATCQVQGSAWVAQLIFGDVGIGKKKTAGAPAVEVPKLAVGLPWPLAKVIHQVLGAAIEHYERTEGAIAIPKSVGVSLAAQLEAVAKSQKPATS